MSHFKLFDQATINPNKIAIIDPIGIHAYHELNTKSDELAAALLSVQSDLNESRIAFMLSPGFDYTTMLWGIWKAGGIAVPLCIDHPTEALTHTIADAQCSVIISHSKFLASIQGIAKEHNIPLHAFKDLKASVNRQIVNLTLDREGLILYTSGTTSKPKGVVITFRNIQSQVVSLLSAWKWVSTDHILNVLPLHHVHGIVNVLICALWSGATIEFLPKFSAKKVFDKFCEGDIKLFMAVPTIYYKLINYYNGMPAKQQQAVTECLKKFRLMVSGSAALPVSTLEKWKEISGHVLLERYGMTEIGMALSNPYRGQRRPGYVGQPLPGVEVRLINDEGLPIIGDDPGEIQIKGDNVFKTYWNNKTATEASFQDDWFKTGDVAILKDNNYKILGRNSMDIIKSGGYKISAIEIEEILLSHDRILECAVVGLPDEEWGEVVTAFLVIKKDLDLTQLSNWLKTKLPAYKLPRGFQILEVLPRNALGKVTKNKLKELLA